MTLKREFDEYLVLSLCGFVLLALADAERRAVTGVPHAAAAWPGDPRYELEHFAYCAEDTHRLIVPTAELPEALGRRCGEESGKERF